MRKTIYSTLTDPRAGRDNLDKLSRAIQQEDRRYPGFNLFDPSDDTLFRAMPRRHPPDQNDVVATGLELRELIVSTV
jgi:hypothetical protein